MRGPIDVSTEAVEGVLAEVNGGLGNGLGLSNGTHRLVRSQGAAVPWATVMVRSEYGAVACSTVGAATWIGIVAEYDGIAADAAGILQDGGTAYVLATGSITPGDLVGTSDTVGTCQAVTTGAFGRALSGVAGGLVLVQLMSGATLPLTAIDHGGTSGLADDDHVQYVLRAELGSTANLLTGRTYTSPSALEAFSATYTVDKAFDADLATVWRPYDAGGNIAVIDMGATERVTLTTFDVLQNAGSGAARVTDVEVETSDDNATWVNQGTFPTVPIATPLPSGIAQQHRAVFSGATARYWRLTFIPPDVPRIAEVRGYRAFADGHDLFSDLHADIDVSTPPTDGQALLWDTTSATWIPGAAGGGGSPNLDGGVPSSTYGGIAALDAGGA